MPDDEMDNDSGVEERKLLGLDRSDWEVTVGGRVLREETEDEVRLAGTEVVKEVLILVEIGDDERVEVLIGIVDSGVMYVETVLVGIVPGNVEALFEVCRWGESHASGCWNRAPQRRRNRDRRTYPTIQSLNTKSRPVITNQKRRDMRDGRSLLPILTNTRRLRSTRCRDRET